MDEQFEEALARLVAEYERLFEHPPPEDPALHAAWLADRKRLQTAVVAFLRPEIEPMARAVAREIRLRDPDEFAAVSVRNLISPRLTAPIPRICMWAPSLGAFEPWVTRTLREMVAAHTCNDPVR